MTLTRRSFIAKAALASCAPTLATLATRAERAAALDWAKPTIPTPPDARLGAQGPGAPKRTGQETKLCSAEAKNAAIYVYHGSPLIAVDRARSAELSSWGASL